MSKQLSEKDHLTMFIIEHILEGKTSQQTFNMFINTTDEPETKNRLLHLFNSTYFELINSNPWLNSQENANQLKQFKNA